MASYGIRKSALKKNGRAATDHLLETFDIESLSVWILSAAGSRNLPSSFNHKTFHLKDTMVAH